MRLIRFPILAIRSLIRPTRLCVSSKWSGLKRMPTVKACYQLSHTPNSTKRWGAPASTSIIRRSWTPSQCHRWRFLPKWATSTRSRRLVKNISRRLCLSSGRRDQYSTTRAARITSLMSWRHKKNSASRLCWNYVMPTLVTTRTTITKRSLILIRRTWCTNPMKTNTRRTWAGKLEQRRRTRAGGPPCKD